MLEILFNDFGSMAIGYILYIIIYWKENHCIMRFGHGLLRDDVLLIILPIVGLILSLF